ncbi:MAG: hypothetical protein RL301_840, partial [Actinomycetota bacterium]
LTESMKRAIDETNRRRAKQIVYNTERGVDPQPLRKKISDITELIAKESEDTSILLAGKKITAPDIGLEIASGTSLPRQELMALIGSLTDQMQAAAADLQFELAARLRDEIKDLKRELRNMENAGA